MATRQREGGRFARNPETRPEWLRYWEDPSSPHPDRIGPQKPVQAGRRAFPKGQGYCHHYQMENEHYHPTMEELERCPE
jgi:hypothetical protein